MTKKSKLKSKRETQPGIALIPSTNIALDKLVPSAANVRQVQDDVLIDALAESIARRSLLQSLSVRPVLDDNGAETGTYEVQAGGRRLRALQLLVTQKRLPKDAPVPCIVKTGGIAEDDSLAENTDREALHPLDEFRAFAVLREKGQSEGDIAAAYMVTPAVVRQRLKLASASPVLLEAYAEDRIKLDQLMAFCVTDDHARQEQVLDMIEQRQTYGAAHNIRRLLTETAIEADDPRARFVGMEAYVNAGGAVMRDLFEEDGGGWLQDPALLMRLVSEKLAAERDAVLAQGWKWVEVCPESPYALKQALRRLQPMEVPLSDEEESEYEALGEEYDELVEGLSDESDVDEKVKARLEAIEMRQAELDNRPPKFAAEDIARGGVLLSVGHNGKLNVEYGFVRREDDTVAGDVDSGGPVGRNGHAAGGIDQNASAPDSDEGETDAGKPLPERLIQDLTAYRTAALRNALAQDYNVAFLAVLHALCLKLFYPYAQHSCLQISAQEHFPAQAPGLGDLAAAKAVEERHAQWEAKLPEDPDKLWDALAEIFREGQFTPLLAHCVSMTVNAVRDPHQSRRDAIRHADRLAAALSLNMQDAGWETRADNYLGRVTKPRILDAVREAKGESTARLIEHLKKTDMAKEAERLLKDTDWLPDALRAPADVAPPPLYDDEQPAPETAASLPAFLADSTEEADETAPTPAQ
jgi:ParB family transcriptional regulator, chromosome partitioning protein